MNTKKIVRNFALAAVLSLAALLPSKAKAGDPESCAAIYNVTVNALLSNVMGVQNACAAAYGYGTDPFWACYSPYYYIFSNAMVQANNDYNACLNS